jgi:hypothetical protein
MRFGKVATFFVAFAVPVSQKSKSTPATRSIEQAGVSFYPALIERQVVRLQPK